MPHPEHPHTEMREAEKPSRLETFVVFIRHGEAEKLPGAENDESIDAARPLTAKGQTQVEAGGASIAEEIPLRRGDMVFVRHSPRVRAEETADRVAAVFLEKQKEHGVEEIYMPETTSRGKQTLVFPNEASGQVYHGAGKRKGTSKGVSEEWVRDAELFQADMDAAGGTERKAADVIATQQKDFQQTVALADRTSRAFGKRWDKMEMPEEIPAPRMVILLGSHGFASEPWLLEAVREYEMAHQTQVPIELGYGEHWTLRLPPDPRESATLMIAGHTIPVKEELLRRIKNNVKE
ncbi:MAG: histidine phosphatase family protein [Patescibacteria group bacterium]